MGGVCGGQQKVANAEPNTFRMLLLGAGEAGKSTIFKQVKIQKRGGFDENSISDYRRMIQSKILEWTKTIVQQADPNGISECSAEAEAIKAVEIKAEEPVDLTEDQRVGILKLWKLEEMQKTFEKTHAVIDESTRRLIQNCEQCCAADYKPSESDILHFRSPTTDIAEIDYDVSEYVKFRFIDIGGQRKERLKWNTVGDITAVVFVVAMDEYNKTLVEDTSRNRMKESLLLFRMITTKHFADKPVVLLLNKRDLFTEKIKTVDLNCCFPDYTGGCNYEPAAAYITNEFKKVAGPERENIYTHQICATDRDNMTKIFSSVEEIVIQENMASSGM